jgi:hypothetical protein
LDKVQLSEVVKLRPDLFEAKAIRAGEYVGVLFMLAGTILLYAMYRNLMAPPATFLEVGLGLFLTSSRANVHFDIGPSYEENS